MARGIAGYLDDDLGRERTRRQAYAYGRTMTWPEVGARHVELFEALAAVPDAGRACPRAPAATGPDVAVLNVGHLLRFTDDTGVLQHATWQTPARPHGYATDDVGRALVIAVRHRAWSGSLELDRVARTCLAYLAHAQRADGAFRNLMGYDRTWLDELGSEDTVGQAVWGLGTAAGAGADQAMRGHADVLLRRALPAAGALTHPRAVAYAITGLYVALERHRGDCRCWSC